MPPPLAGSVARNLRAAGALSTPAYAVGSSSRFAFSSSAPDSEAAPLFLRRFGARAASPLRDGAFFVGDDARPLLGAGGDRRAGGGGAGGGGGGAPAASAADMASASRSDSWNARSSSGFVATKCSVRRRRRFVLAASAMA